MANTAPFSCPLGIDVASVVLANAEAFSANGIVANSSGVAVNTCTISSNLSTNTLTANTANALSVTANQVFVNVVSGNTASISGRLIANQVMVNTVSGNISTYINLTSNQVFVNTISGNTLVVNNFSPSTININPVHSGNSSIYTEIKEDGMYLSTAAGLNRHMPAEVVLQTGDAAGTSSFLVNFSTEVASGLYNSMKLVLANVRTSASANLSMRVSNNGTTANTSSNYRNMLVYSKSSSAGGSTEDAAFNLNLGHDIIITSNNSAIYGLEIFLYDTNATANIKPTYSYGTIVGGVGGSGTTPFVWSGGGSFTVSIVLKGVQIFLSAGTFTSCKWALVGRRF